MTSGDELFLSVYMEAPDITSLALMRHDQCVALWRRRGAQVEIVRYWELERITGLKHHRLPIRDHDDVIAFLDELLAQEGVRMADMTAVWGTRGISTEEVGEFLPPDLCVHSASHLFSAVLSDWELFRTETVLGLAMDAGPDMNLEAKRRENVYVGCVSVAGEMAIFPIESPGAVWLLARGQFGREEGTLMALASATTCEVELDVDELVDDLPFWTLADVFASGDTVLRAATSVVREALAGSSGRLAARFDSRFSEEDNLQSAIMKIVDKASTAVARRNIVRARREHDLDLPRTWIALSGGFTLNCPTNTRLMNEFGFRGLLVPPCVNDGGQALGLGLLGLHQRGITAEADFCLRNAFHGRRAPAVDDVLERFAPALASVEHVDLGRAVEDILEHPIAWVQGAAEIGPRALGHRSLLGDPRASETKDVLNRVKQRQWWRPVAPIVLAEAVGEWFEEDRPSPYMLEVFTCRADKRSAIPAVLHLDDTARVQTVSPDDDPILHTLVRAFGEATGVPILGNTSLNDRGEPLVDRAEHALNFCVRKGIRVAYFDDVRVELRDDAAALLGLDGPERRDDEAFVRDARRWAELWAEWEDLGLGPEELYVWAWNPDVRRMIDPFSGRGAAVLRRLTPTYLARMSDLERRFLLHLISFFGPTADPHVSAASDQLVGGAYRIQEAEPA